MTTQQQNEDAPMALADAEGKPSTPERVTIVNQKIQMPGSEPEPVPAIYEAMHAAIADIDQLGAISQQGKGPSTHQSYPYFTPGQVIATARQVFVKHGIIVEPTLLVQRHDDLLATPYPFEALTAFAGGGSAASASVIEGALTALRSQAEKSIPKARTTAVVVGSFRFIAVVDGSAITATIPASARDDGDKALRKALTTSFKVALMQTLFISSEEGDADADHSPAATGEDADAPTQNRQGQQRTAARGGDPKPVREKATPKPRQTAAQKKAEQEAAAAAEPDTRSEGEIAEEGAQAPEPEQAPQPPAQKAPAAAETAGGDDVETLRLELREALVGTGFSLTQQNTIAKAAGVDAPRAAWLSDPASIRTVISAVKKAAETGEVG